MSDFILFKIPTDFSYFKRSVLSKFVEQQSGRNFDLGVNSGAGKPIEVKVRFEQREIE